jgi:hypothetical protein
VLLAEEPDGRRNTGLEEARAAEETDNLHIAVVAEEDTDRSRRHHSHHWEVEGLAAEAGCSIAVEEEDREVVLRNRPDDFRSRDSPDPDSKTWLAISRFFRLEMADLDAMLQGIGRA